MSWVNTKIYEKLLKEYQAMSYQYSRVMSENNNFSFQLKKQRLQTIKLRESVQKLRQELRNKK